MKTIKMMALCAVALGGWGASAATWYVSPSGEDSNAGTTEGTPFKTINAALAKISYGSSGDEVILAAGTYEVTETLTVTRSAGVTIRGATGNRDDVVVNGGGTAKLFSTVDTTKNLGIRDLTLRGSSAELELEGTNVTLSNVVSVASARIRLGASCVVEDCLFKDNEAGALNLRGAGCVIRRTSFVNNVNGDDNGAAVTTFCANESFFDCTFEGNSVTNASSSYNKGGAVYISGYDSLFSNCTFTANSATGAGGALSVWERVPFRLVDCTFERNTSGWRGGAVSCGLPTGGVVRCTFVGNVASNAASAKAEVARGGAVSMDGMEMGGKGATEDVFSEFSECHFASNVVYGSQGGAVSLSFIRVANFADCTFVGNEVRTNGVCAADITGGGAVAAHEIQNVNNDRLYFDRCRFVDNRSSSGGGAVEFQCLYAAPAYLRNCLFDGNVCTGGASFGGAIETRNVEITNCTFVRNQSSWCAPAVYLIANAGAVTNCVFALNESPKANGTHAKNDCDVAWADTSASWTTSGFVLYNCYTYCESDKTARYAGKGQTELATARNCVTVVDGTLPFVDAAAGDFMPKKGSEIIDKGLYADWMAGAADLRGNASKWGRINGTVDLGCYEFWPVLGMMFIVR